MIADQAWLIAKHLRGESSLYLSFYTHDQGLIRTLYKGGRKHTHRSPIESFTPYWLDLNPGRQVYFVNKIEPISAPLSLQNTALVCAYYINELIYYSLKQPEPSPELFNHYSHCLHALATMEENQSMEMLLREFEWALLSNCGAGFSFTTDSNNQAIDAQLFYQFNPQEGFLPAPSGIAGKTIINIKNQDFIEKETRLSAKHIMRQAINELLNHRPLNSRNLLQSHPPVNKSTL